MDMAAEGITADSIFIQNSRPIKFVVNRINISDQDREWITDVLIPELQRLGDSGVVFGRAAASPEGPYDNNRVSRNLVGINFRHPNVMPNFAVWKTITYRHWHRWCCQPRF